MLKNEIEKLSSDFETKIEQEYSKAETVLKDDAQKSLALKQKKDEALACKKQNKEQLELKLKNLGEKVYDIVQGEKHTHGDEAMIDFTVVLETQKTNFAKFVTELTRNM